MRQGPPEDAVRAEVERIAASPYFANAERLGRFLRYVVEETLAGRAEQIKEYAVGLEVYGRKPDYDPKVDSIVRVEAGRLRTKLEQYYAHEGCENAVRIAVPKRSYVPAFSWRAEAAAPRPRRRRWLYAVAAALLLAAGLGFLYWRTPRPGPHVGFFSLAVLPFVNLSGGSEMERFTDGLTEQITNQLAG